MGETSPESHTPENRQQTSDTPGRSPGSEPSDNPTAGAPSIGSSGPVPPPPMAKPSVGDTRPAADGQFGDRDTSSPNQGGGGSGKRRRRRRGGRGSGQGGNNQGGNNQGGNNQGGNNQGKQGKQGKQGNKGNKGNKGNRGNKGSQPVEAITDDGPLELDEETLKARRGRERRGKPLGRYMMCVSVAEGGTQIAVLEGRNLIEHYLSRPADDVSEIHGNVYLAKVQNVLPGMEAAFVDIGTPKNAVLYRGDLQFDPDEVEGGGKARIEHVLKARQTILCQVTKNPIAHKGARLTQEVSLPGRFVVLVPNNSTYGISKRLPDKERKRLRSILDRVKPAEHGLIVRTAAEDITAEELERDVGRLVQQWTDIEALAKKSSSPSLLYREPEAVFRFIREEFTKDYRGVVIDDRDLYEKVLVYVQGVNPALADRVQFYDSGPGGSESLPLFECHHVHEQLRKAVDRKVWLPSGGSLIIEHTEALTVIDVNTGKNVGKKSLEETVFRNNLEAAEETARQLRLRDIGGIIVIDFVDMDVKKNREAVAATLRDALARDKTRTQVFDISDLGLVEMTRKRIGEGLLESFSERCDDCDGRGVALDEELLLAKPGK